MKRSLTLLLSCAALSGCMVGPNYVSPAPKAPAQQDFASGNSPSFVPAEPPADWWTLLDAPILDRLVADALAANTDLRVAAANLRAARASLSEARTARLPSTNISGNYTYSQQSGATLAPFGVTGAGPRLETYDVGIDASYQFDLFGRIARTIQASRADLEAVQATYDLTRVTVVAETIRAYADACASGRQLGVARDTLRVQEETFDLTRRRVEGGRGTALDTSQASSLLEQTRADVPVLEAQRKSALFRLATLTGRPPAEYPAEVEACTTPPVARSAIPIGSGSSLLARRPDIRAAERRLAAATARVGVATADLYPNISFGAGIGTTATSVGNLFSGDSLRFSLGPLMSWSFPNIAAARARIRQAEASADGALATFDGTWLTALRETETALTQYVSIGQRVATLRRARDAGREAARIARLRYQAGAEDFQIVLDAERSLAGSESLLAQAEGQFSDATVTLFLALGGGWETPVPQPAASSAN